MRKNSAGFTLIEILLVVFLLGAFLSVAAPGLFGTDDMSLRRASRGLVTTIRHLYARAAFEKRVYRLSFDVDSGEYWTEVLVGNRFAAEGDSVPGKRKLPAGVSFADVQTERTRGKVTSGREAFILFLPTGFVDPAVVHLAAGRDGFYTLSTSPHTGVARVFDEYVEFSDLSLRTARRAGGE